jgi:Fe2+ transport system protein B
LSDISSPKVRWKQNATIKEAVTENALENANKNARESKKLEIKVKEEKQQLEEEGGQKEKVRTPEQVRKSYNKYSDHLITGPEIGLPVFLCLITRVPILDPIIVLLFTGNQSTISFQTVFDCCKQSLEQLSIQEHRILNTPLVC